ncbi:MAG: VOC family protein [Chloroflexaceae bacterium]|jgi:catechol 2,3-dioxygenase-like lactoylglutathione lyase family enzyme|nr:VOC family protein [Chloroflexaceae bacterium]
MGDDKKQFNIYLPTALIRRLKYAAVDADQSLSAFVEEALQRYLADSGGSTGHARPDPALQPMLIVYSPNLERAIEFYQRLGFQLTVWNRPRLWAELRWGETLLALHYVESLPRPQGSRAELSFVCRESLEAVVDRLEQAGITPEHPITDESFGRYIVICDPDGTRIQINEHDTGLYT